MLRMNAGSCIVVGIETATAQHFDQVLTLLRHASLPTADLSAARSAEFLVAVEDGAVVGAIGMEVHSDAALLRSLVVEGGRRGSGVGTALVSAAEKSALASQVREIVLLTETAEKFFEQRGYRVIDRSAAPLAVQSAQEFKALCPQSAACMQKRLARSESPR
jgi:amino-acid N-acetyltransferase